MDSIHPLKHSKCLKPLPVRLGPWHGSPACPPLSTAPSLESVPHCWGLAPEVVGTSSHIDENQPAAKIKVREKTMLQICPGCFSSFCAMRLAGLLRDIEPIDVDHHFGTDTSLRSLQCTRFSHFSCVCSRRLRRIVSMNTRNTLCMHVV